MICPGRPCERKSAKLPPSLSQDVLSAMASPAERQGGFRCQARCRKEANQIGMFHHVLKVLDCYTSRLSFSITETGKGRKLTRPTRSTDA